MIKAVIFDIDGVLIDSLEANYQYYLHVFKVLGKQFVTRQEYNSNYEGLTMKAMLNKVMGFTGSELETNFELIKKTTPHFSELYKTPPGEKEAIEILSKKFKLAIVTSKYSVESTFKVIGQERKFSVVVMFGDYQKPKPDPESLLMALKKLQVKANETVYIGDRESDLLAAKAAGTYFITFYGVSGKIFKDADANVKTFTELPGAIEKLS